MKIGDLVVTKDDLCPGVIINIVDSNLFNNDKIVLVLWAGATRPKRCLQTGLKRVNS